MKKIFFVFCLLMNASTILAQDFTQFCKSLQLMMAESKTGFPSFKGALRDTSKAGQFRIKNEIIEGSQYESGMIYVDEKQDEDLYGAGARGNILTMWTRKIGDFTNTKADTVLYNQFLQYGGIIYNQCFQKYIVAQERLTPAKQASVIISFIISETPVLDSYKERDHKKCLNQPVLTMTLERGYGSNEAFVRISIVYNYIK